MSTSSPHTLLLVEDNEDDVFAFQYVFQSARIIDPILRIVCDGQQAINYLSGHGKFSDRSLFPKPDLVFLDLKLPFFSGHEIVKWIREQSDTPSLPVVMLSGSDESRDHERAIGGGATDYLVKPASLKDIQRVLHDQGLDLKIIERE